MVQIVFKQLHEELELHVRRKKDEAGDLRPQEKDEAGASSIPGKDAHVGRLYKCLTYHLHIITI